MPGIAAWHASRHLGRRNSQEERNDLERSARSAWQGMQAAFFAVTWLNPTRAFAGPSAVATTTVVAQV